MIPARPSDLPSKSPKILVVDDDHRVRELLEMALAAHGFSVLTASDGEEAIKQALGQRPDLVVLDVRLPKKSGLEVCDLLRRDPDDPSVPIILVSAAVEIDARLQAFTRGADDYLAKPFSPKELIARVKRLLSRSTEARNALRRAQELERELNRVREEVRRAHVESRREQGLRQLAFGIGRELLGDLDDVVLSARLLQAIQAKLGVGVAGLLVCEHPGGELVPTAVRGDAFDRMAGLELDPDGELARFLAGLGRPASTAELERVPELRAEIAAFVSSRFTLLAPLRGGTGLEALVVTDERVDGTEPSREDLEVLAGLCEIGEIAIQNSLRFHAQVDRLLELLAEKEVASAAEGAVRAEAALLVGRAARARGIPPRQRDLLRHAVALGPWGLSDEGRQALDRIRGNDPTGRVTELERMLERALGREASGGALSVESVRAGLLLGAAFDYVAARTGGAGVEEALVAAVNRAGPGLDLSTRRELLAAGRDVFAVEGDAA